MKKPVIVLVGLGWASASFIKTIDTNQFDIRLYSKNHFVYTPLLAQNIKNDRTLELPCEDINNKVIFTSREIVDVDFEKHVILDNDDAIHYDYLILAHGAGVNTYNIKGVHENCYFIKDEANVNLLRDKISSLPHHSSIAVIGCGLTGSEVIGSLMDYKKFNIHAVDALPRPLMVVDDELSTFTLDLWKVYNVNTYMDHKVSFIDKNCIGFSNNSNKIHYDIAIWCGGVKKTPFTDKILSRLNVSDNKGIPIDDCLRVKHTENVFAMGDCTNSSDPASAQVAYQQGQYLAHQFNNRFPFKTPFRYIDRGHIGYIGMKQSIIQTPYFRNGGKLTYYLNTIVHLYNGINFKQRLYLATR